MVFPDHQQYPTWLPEDSFEASSGSPKENMVHPKTPGEKVSHRGIL